jgi:phosphate transport system permease protein
VSTVDLSALQRPNDRLRRRRFVNHGMEAVAWIAAVIAVAILGIVVWSVARQGISQVNWDFITKPQLPYEPTVPQGLANAFVGSLVIVGCAAGMALPFGILVAVYVNEFAPRFIRNVVGLALDVLAGIPAIVLGFFVFYLIVIPTHHQSGLAAAFALSIIMLPLIARSTIEVLALVPNTLREAALGLGAPRWRTTLGVVLPQTIGGILTGATLAVARAAGETAPILFTSSLVGVGTSLNPLHPLATVPVAIYELTDQPDELSHQRAWAAAFVLLMFILFASLGARWLATRSRRKLGRATR